MNRPQSVSSPLSLFSARPNVFIERCSVRLLSQTRQEFTKDYVSHEASLSPAAGLGAELQPGFILSLEPGPDAPQNLNLVLV